MPRTLRKTWTNKKYGWDRRVRWFRSPSDVRLCFETIERKWNKIYQDTTIAQIDYDAFRNGQDPEGISNCGDI